MDAGQRASAQARPAGPRNVWLVTAAGLVRSMAVGLSGVLVAIDLASRGWDVRAAGLLVTAGLAGIALNTLLTSLWADRFGRRRTLLLLGALSVLGGVSLAVLDSRPLLLVAAFVGMVNGLGRDRGPAYALDQALIADAVDPRQRTLALAWYSMMLDIGLALGSLLAGLPFVLRAHWDFELTDSYRAAWVAYSVLALLATVVYVFVSREVEAPGAGKRAARDGVSTESRRRIARLAALTGMDSLGGGFLSGALVSYWFFQRFGVGEELIGLLFFAARMANAASHLAAAWMARRIGLLNTMVFTHIPSSLFLMAVPFAPTFGWAVVMFLLREGLVEMDVPTRQSYILAVVRPQERTLASGVTTLTRNIAYALAPALAGVAMKSVALASPLFLGGGIKIAYDLLLYASFRRIKPPEETGGVSS